ASSGFIPGITGGGSSVRLWDVNTGTCLALAPTPGLEGGFIAFSPEGSRLAFGGFNSPLMVMDLKTGARSVGDAASANCKAVAWSPDGRRLLTVQANGTDGTVRLWRADTVVQAAEATARV